MLLLHCKDRFHQTAGRDIGVAEPLGNLAVARDGDSLGDQVFGDHLNKIVPGDILGVASLHQGGGVEVRLSLQLHDSLGNLISVTLLLSGVLKELGGNRSSVDSFGHEVVALVPKDANQFRGERLVQYRDHPFAVGSVRFGNRTFLNVRAGVGTKGFDIGAMFFHA